MIDVSPVDVCDYVWLWLCVCERVVCLEKFCTPSPPETVVYWAITRELHGIGWLLVFVSNAQLLWSGKAKRRGGKSEAEKQPLKTEGRWMKKRKRWKKYSGCGGRSTEEKFMAAIAKVRLFFFIFLFCDFTPSLPLIQTLNFTWNIHTITPSSCAVIAHTLTQCKRAHFKCYCIQSLVLSIKWVDGLSFLFFFGAPLYYWEGVDVSCISEVGRALNEAGGEEMPWRITRIGRQNPIWWRLFALTLFLSRNMSG